MAFTLQPATKDGFVNREKILDEIFFTVADERTRMGFARVVDTFYGSGCVGLWLNVPNLRGAACIESVN